MPTDRELEEGARLVTYEYLMLVEAGRRWSDQSLREYSKSAKWEHRIVTDVFLLHARNLLDFLVPRASAKSRDVVAQHYASTWACSQDETLAGRTIADWRDRIDKLLSHVTYRRTAMISETQPQPRWPIEKLHEDLVMRFCEFLKSLPASRREWFGAEVRAACRS